LGRAALDARLLGHESALAAELEAINRAKELGWDLTKLEQRRTVYASHRPWTGNLLQF